MNIEGNGYATSTNSPVVSSTVGIRAVLFEPDDQLRLQFRQAMQQERVFTLTGEARDWTYCAHLLDMTIPELLVARLNAIPDHWWTDSLRSSAFPLIIGLGDADTLAPLDRRVIQVLRLPVQNGEVRNALLRGQAEVYTHKAQELAYLLRQYTASAAGPSMYLASIAVDHEGHKLHLDTHTISAILANANYCRLHTPAGVYEIRETMNGLCSKLDPTLFARIHRSVIVNVSRVREVSVSRDTPITVVLQDGMELPIGPNFRHAISELGLRKRA